MSLGRISIADEVKLFLERSIIYNVLLLMTDSKSRELPLSENLFYSRLRETILLGIRRKSAKITIAPYPKEEQDISNY